MASKLKKLLATTLVATALFGGGLATAPSAFALGQQETSSQSLENLIDDVKSEVDDKIYRTPTGDGIRGRDIIESDGADVVVTDKFDELSEADKNRFLSDVDTAVQDSKEDDREAVNSGQDKTNLVTEGTESAFWAKVRDKNSVASRMITVATKDVRADFLSGSVFLRPFTPYVNTGMAVFIILASLMFFFFIAVDVFFFMTPPFQYLVLNGSGNKYQKVIGSFVSNRAQSALKESEQGGNPLIKYFFKSFVQMFGYALVLLYFTGSSMLTLVGPLANLVSGILGF